MGLGNIGSTKASAASSHGEEEGVTVGTIWSLQGLPPGPFLETRLRGPPERSTGLPSSWCVLAKL